MRSILTIAEREFRALITSPIGYVVMMFFLFVAGVFFVAPLQQNVANIRYVVANTVIWLVFLLPALTMRLVAEEKKTGTIELLMTSPVTEAEVIFGKFLGVLGYYCIILFSTMEFVMLLGWVRDSAAKPLFPTYTGLVLLVASLILMTLAALDESKWLGIASAACGAGALVCAGFAARQMGEWGPVLTGYLGLLMLGAVFIAIGLMMSTLTRNQIVAWVSTAAVLLLLTVLLSWITRELPATAPSLEAGPNAEAYIRYGLGYLKYLTAVVLQALNLQSYLENFAQGVLDLRDFLLYLSVIAASLFFAVRGLVNWRAA